MGRPVVIAGIAIHNRFPAADEFQDITSKSKPTPENPITLHVSLTQRDGRIVRVGTLAMAVGGMSSSVRAQDAHQQPSKVFGLRQSLSSTKPGQLHRCSFSDCRRRPAGDETTIHFDGWSASRPCAVVVRNGVVGSIPLAPGPEGTPRATRMGVSPVDPSRSP